MRQVVRQVVRRTMVTTHHPETRVCQGQPRQGRQGLLSLAVLAAILVGFLSMSAERSWSQPVDTPPATVDTRGQSVVVDGVEFAGRTYWLPEQGSTFAPQVDAIFWYVMWISIISFVGIVGVMVYFVLKYQRKPGDQPYNVSGPTHSTALEVWWSLIPLLLVAVMFFWGLKVYIEMATPPADALTIDCEASQWSFAFRYPNGAVVKDLHIPKGRDVRIRLTSTDVLHAIFIPSARVKMDIVPGRRTHVWFNAVKSTGPKGAPDSGHDTRHIFCAEYCGTQHSVMYSQLFVHEDEEDYEAFLATWGPEDDWSPAQRGRWFFKNKGCATCHTEDESRSVGPGWLETSKLWQANGQRSVRLDDASVVQVPVNEEYVIDSIKQPGREYVHDADNPYTGNMPAVKFNAETDYSDIAAFIKSLAEGNPPTDADIEKK